MNLRSRYHQVWIKAGKELKTACVTCCRPYEFTVMSFGLTNAPTTFCTFINHIFRTFLDKFVVVYLDDILIYSKMMEEHLEHPRAIFNTLCAHRLYLNLTKCVFGTKEVGLLDHIVGHGQVKMDHSKVATIDQWPLLTCIIEL